MADVTVVAAEVLPLADTSRKRGIFGATGTAGQLVYFDESAGTYKLSDANGASALRVVAGILMLSGVAGQDCVIADGGTIDPGFTVTVGAVYVASATPGGIAPVADLATGWYTTIVGVGISASILKLIFYNSLTAVP